MAPKMRPFFVLAIFVFSSTLNYCSGYKILFYNPKFGPSHVTFTGKIADTLAAAGHEVVVYQPVLNEHIDFTGSKHKSIRYYTMPRNYSLDNNMNSIQDTMWDELSIAKMRNMMTHFNAVAHEFCGQVMIDNENLEKLKAEKFDLGITEIFEPCGFGVFHKIGLKKHITTFAGSLSASAASLLGIKLHPSYLPTMMGSTTDQMTFFERVKNFCGLVLEVGLMANSFKYGSETAIQAHFPDFRINEAVANSAFYYINSDEHVDYPQPITHKIIYMAGLGKIQAKPLEKKYTDIFDSAKKGVILFSFGSVVQSEKMPSKLKQTFLGAFAEFPEINFIWKYENETHEIAKGFPNVFTGKWLPQNDILDHPKLLAFISHGGMNSVMEGSTKGVPMICIPVFADQTRNSMLLVRRGSALVINKMEITKEKIMESIKEIIKNNSYKENAKMLSKMVNAKPMPAGERVLKYAEFAAEFGDSETLETEGRRQSFIVLYSLDVLAFLFASIAIVLFIAVFIVKKLLKFVQRILSLSRKLKSA